MAVHPIQCPAGVFLPGAVGTGVWASAFFAMVDTRSFPLIVLATTVGPAAVPAGPGRHRPARRTRPAHRP
ncbi:hypothetical protein [Kitasatospora sp. NPDC051914]|uniref:hypothetical protein n=1 Tax=Kitasatospora sp. NPDC051914 TaxID=3154945 RepID=UPI00343F0A44